MNLKGIFSYCFTTLVAEPFPIRADSRLVPSQWETSLHSNTVSHWLGVNLAKVYFHTALLHWYQIHFLLVCGIRADSRLAPSQWETSLQSNAVSHWLGANLAKVYFHTALLHWYQSRFLLVCVVWLPWGHSPLIPSSIPLPWYHQITCVAASKNAFMLLPIFKTCVFVVERDKIDGLVQERCNSNVLALELYVFLALTHRNNR